MQKPHHPIRCRASDQIPLHSHGSARSGPSYDAASDAACVRVVWPGRRCRHGGRRRRSCSADANAPTHAWIAPSREWRGWRCSMSRGLRRDEVVARGAQARHPTAACEVLGSRWIVLGDFMVVSQSASSLVPRPSFVQATAPQNVLSTLCQPVGANGSIMLVVSAAHFSQAVLRPVTRTRPARLVGTGCARPCGGVEGMKPAAPAQGRRARKQAGPHQRTARMPAGERFIDDLSRPTVPP